MKLTVQIVLHADDDTETVVREAFTLQREQPLALDTLGLQLAEAKDLLAAVGGHAGLPPSRRHVVLPGGVPGCPDCGVARRHKGEREKLYDPKINRSYAELAAHYGALVDPARAFKRQNPHRVGAPLRKPFEGYWRARRGEYRVRYTINDSTPIVQVVDISHQRDAYR